MTNAKFILNASCLGVASCGGFKVTKELGRYLGAHISQGRVSTNKFKHVTKKVQSRLCSWKQQCLSLAGKLTLAGSVLGSFATFQIQHERIPKSIYHDI